MNDVLELSEYLKIGIQLESGEISPEEGSRLFNDFFSKLIIKDYMKHKDKLINLAQIIMRLEGFQDEITSTAYMEMGRVFYGLLKYCVNLHVDIEVFGGLYSVYDSIREHGLYDYILGFCQKDFRIFSEMLDNMVNITHIKQLANTSALFDGAAFEEWMVTMKEFKDQLTPELLKELIAFNNQNEESTKNLLESLSKMAVDETNHEMASALVVPNGSDDGEKA